MALLNAKDKALMTDPHLNILQSPFTASKVSNLRLGQRVSVKGSLIACRGDALNALNADGAWMKGLSGLGFFNAAPLVIGRDGSWSVCSAGPSVTARSESELVSLIKRNAIHILLGQGAMGRDMCRACAEQKCVYLQTIGLAGASIAKAIRAVDHIHSGRSVISDDGPWRIEVDGIEAVVAIDMAGKNLNSRVQRRAARCVSTLMGKGR